MSNREIVFSQRVGRRGKRGAPILLNSPDEVEDLRAQMSWRRLAAMKTRLLLVLASIPLLAQVPVTSPYSAVQVSETTQTLGDGTHISHVGMKVLIYRDSSGRT